MTIFDWLVEIDRKLFLIINGHYSVFLDAFFYGVSYKYTWIPFYVLLLYFLVKKHKKQSYLPILLIIISIVLSDQISVHLFKNTFHRLRPCHNEALQAWVHLVKNHCGGRYGFVSSHAANSFALISIVYRQVFYGNKKVLTALVFWGILVAYSRVYLGVHYPADVFAGAVLGWIIGASVHFTASRLFNRNQ